MRTRYDRYYLWIPFVLIDIGLREVGPAAFAVYLVLMREAWRGSRVPEMIRGRYEKFMNRYSDHYLLVAAVTVREIAERTGLSVREVNSMIAVLVEHRWICRIEGLRSTAYLLGCRRNAALRRAHAEFRAVRRSFRAATGKDVLEADPEEINRRLKPHLEIGFAFVDHLMREVKPRRLAILFVLLRMIWRVSRQSCRHRTARARGRQFDDGRLVAHASHEDIGNSVDVCRDTVLRHVREMEKSEWLRVMPGPFEHMYVMGDRVPAADDAEGRWSGAERLYVVTWIESRLTEIEAQRERAEKAESAVPGTRDDAPARPAPASPSETARRGLRRLGDPSKPADQWCPNDVAAYFLLRWQAKWPREEPPPYDHRHREVILSRLTWLALEGKPGVAVIKAVVDVAFDRWGDELRERLRWRDPRPDWKIFGWANVFDVLVREALGEKPAQTRRKDDFDHEAAKEFPAVGDGGFMDRLRAKREGRE